MPDVVIGGSIPLMSVSSVISGICQKLQVFQTKQVSHVKRMGNRLAHILVQFAKGIDSYVTWK